MYCEGSRNPDINPRDPCLPTRWASDCAFRQKKVYLYRARDTIRGIPFFGENGFWMTGLLNAIIFLCFLRGSRCIVRFFLRPRYQFCFSPNISFFFCLKRGLETNAKVNIKVLAKWGVVLRKKSGAPAIVARVIRRTAVGADCVSWARL